MFIIYIVVYIYIFKEEIVEHISIIIQTINLKNGRRENDRIAGCKRRSSSQGSIGPSSQADV